MAASTPTHFPQLVNTEVFDNWLFRLNCMLEERGLKEVTQMEKVEDKSLDAKAKSLIVQCVTDRHLNLIKESKTSKEMIDTMKNTFQRKSVISKITLRRKLLNLKHTYASLEEYFSQFDNVIRELEVAGEKIEENDKVCYLLTGLGDEYNHIITAIETMNTEVKLEFVRAKLLDHEVRSVKPEKENEQTSQSSFVSTVICFCCKKKGHKSFQCRGGYRGRGRRGHRGYSSGRGEAATPAQEESSSTSSSMFIASEQALVSENSSTITFIVDSGATQNFIKEEYECQMIDVKTLPQPLNIKIANGQTLQATKKGFLEAKYNKENITVEAVIVPGLSTNLMSVSQLVGRGMEITFKKGKLIIKSGNKTYLGAKQGQLYTFEVKLRNQEENCKLTKEENANIWHQRLGHICRKNLAILGLPYSKEACDACMKNKSTRIPFRRLQKPRSTKIGDLIHTDVAGPTRVPFP
ncbi:Yokozuna protein [Operophtera brumata]|uniref:Yokozuna protein n=2 Tax=Operophtera brumata TaxID=104452 RepID=A0A0L7LR92_OPEBR|nr:Yokozuna protein [Operophtera brumata]